MTPEERAEHLVAWWLIQRAIDDKAHTPQGNYEFKAMIAQAITAACVGQRRKDAEIAGQGGCICDIGQAHDEYCPVGIAAAIEAQE